MKENLERIFKEQLASYEVPYENGAWEQFSKRLDGTPATPFYRKWWFAASLGTVLVGSAVYFALSSNGNETQHTAAPVEVAADHATVSTPETHNTPANTSTETPKKQTAEAAAPLINHTDQTTGDPQRRDNGSPVRIQDNSQQGDNRQTSGTPQDQNRTNVGQTQAAAYHKLDLPAAVCMNESFTIRNTNEGSVYVTLPGGKSKTVQGKQSMELKPTKAGTINVQIGNTTESIVVNEPLSRLYIDVDASTLYENGIPTLTFDVTGADHAVTWESNISSKTASKNELTVHPFTEREVIVTANSTDMNGCPVSERKRVKIEDPYNLLAPTGFNPLDNDSRTNHFIPFALTLRDTPFEMVIMDPNNMTVLFRTTDPSQGWDGIDSRSGQLVPLNSTWLWKVEMKKPLQGEPQEYKGLITRTARQ